jgi:hypothetical protein
MKTIIQLEVDDTIMLPINVSTDGEEKIEMMEFKVKMIPETTGEFRTRRGFPDVYADLVLTLVKPVEAKKSA